MSLSKAEAARINGAKSKGPVSIDGKARSSRNALKHGLTAEQVVAGGEELTDYTEVRDAYIEQFQPATQMELDLIESLAATRIRLRRAVAVAVETGILASPSLSSAPSINSKPFKRRALPARLRFCETNPTSPSNFRRAPPVMAGLTTLCETNPPAPTHRVEYRTVHTSMRQKLIYAALACATFAAFAIAQEGHPITGTWHGDWGSSAAQRNPLVMFLKWENKTITGTVNPGKNSYDLKSATLDAEKWMVHMEGTTKDGQKVVADGKMEDVGSYNRTITGTWTQGSAKGNFKLTRD